MPHKKQNLKQALQNELRDALNRLKKKTSESHTTINKHETRYKTIEENLVDVEDGECEDHAKYK